MSGPAARPGRQLQIVPMRGNVGTRLRKLARGEVDALVLAMAGLSRLGLLDAVTTPLDPSLLMAAPAQGMPAVEALSPASRTSGTAASIQGRRALAVMPDGQRRAMLVVTRTGHSLAA